jgi:hypothetical protein
MESEGKGLHELFFVTMNGKGGPTILTKVLGDIVCDTLCGNEDEDLGILCADLVEVLDELVALFEVTANLNDLLNIWVSSELHGANVDLNHVTKEIL